MSLGGMVVTVIRIVVVEMPEGKPENVIGRELYHREAKRGLKQAHDIAIRVEVVAGSRAEFCR